MARDLWPKARRSSGANQRALRRVSGLFRLALFVIWTPVREFPVIPQAARAEQVPIPGRTASWQTQGYLEALPTTGKSRPAAWSSCLFCRQHIHQDRPADVFDTHGDAAPGRDLEP